MSKRSSRRKRRERQKKLESRLTPELLTQEGYQAFKQANYTDAIKAWEHARNKPNAPKSLGPALAEAYFRLAEANPNAALNHLQEALKLQPTDSIYRYHLALAYHLKPR